MNSGRAYSIQSVSWEKKFVEWSYIEEVALMLQPLATTNKHPHSYKLQWQNDKGEIRVTQHVLVPFFIRKTYKDEGLCDVVPNNPSHLLLERPWQYDKRVVHDGFKYTYSFKKDRKSIVLPPFSPQHVHQD